MNSGPLSERKYSAIPRPTISSASVSITSSLPSLRATRIGRHSPVNSSIGVSSRKVLPSCVRATQFYSRNIARSTNPEIMWPSWMWHSCIRVVSFDGWHGTAVIHCTLEHPTRDSG